MDLRASGNVPDGIDVVGVPYHAGSKIAVEGLPELDVDLLKRNNFEGNANQVAVVTIGGTTYVALGLGDPDSVTADTFRRAAAQLVRASWKSASAALVLPAGAGAGTSKAVAEGALLGTYRFNEYKSKPDVTSLGVFTVVGGNDSELQEGVVVARAVMMARDLGNEPAGAMTPSRLADFAIEVAAANDLQITVWDEDGARREGFGGLLGVAAGSSQPPRMLKMVYEPAGGSSQTVALVGKGITFDSGGLSLKPAEGMMTMKTDMSGAAAVISTMSTVAALQPSTRVVGFVAATENLPGPSATKPGDVLKARNGKTMEVLNTDAEGRLVLADALSLAVEESPAAIVDVATLTGACIVALGGEITGLMTNHDGFGDQVLAAAGAAGEETWKLPLPARYRKHIDSEIADIKNIGAPKGAAGTLTAGLFLKEFVGEVPWVHLDIAGPARVEADDAYTSRGSTGAAVRTLIELVRNFKAPARAVTQQEGAPIGATVARAARSRRLHER